MATKAEYLADLADAFFIVGTAAVTLADYPREGDNRYDVACISKVNNTLCDVVWRFVVLKDGVVGEEEACDWLQNSAPLEYDLDFLRDITAVLDSNYVDGFQGTPLRGFASYCMSGRFRSCYFHSLTHNGDDPLTFTLKYYYAEKPEGGNMLIGEVPNFDPVKNTGPFVTYGVPRLRERR